MKIYFDKTKFTISLFYEKIKNSNDAILYSKNLSEIIAITYAALGLDMTGLSLSSFSSQRQLIEKEVAGQIKSVHGP